jgi:hypothetical protein
VLLWVLGCIVLLLVTVQLIASPLATRIANQRLAEIDGVIGRVERVNLALWRGDVEIIDLVIHDRETPNDIPLVHIPRATFTGARRPLLRGRIGGQGVIEGAEFYAVKREIVDEPDEELDQRVQEAHDTAMRWQNRLSEAFPTQITRLEVRDGRARFVDLTYDPVVEVGVEELNMVARNLHNLPEWEAPPATIEVTGITSGGGHLELYIEAEPMAQPLRFYSSFGIEDLVLPDLDNFMRAYAMVEVTEGTFSLYSEIRAGEGRYEGYVRPFFQDLEFEPVREEEKSLGRRIIERVASAATALLENPETDQIATQTPFEGTFDENEADLWATLGNLLRNAFLDAIRQGFDPQSPEDPAAAE